MNLYEKCHAEFTVLEELKTWLTERNFKILASKVDEFESERFDADNLAVS